MRKSIALAPIVLAVLLAALPAAAANLTVSEQNKDYSPKTLTINKGDTVTFKNQDTVSHNVISSTAAIRST